MTSPTPEPEALDVTWTAPWPVAEDGAPLTTWQVEALTRTGRVKGLTLDALAALGAERLGLPAEWSALTVGQARRLLAYAQGL